MAFKGLKNIFSNRAAAMGLAAVVAVGATATPAYGQSASADTGNDNPRIVLASHTSSNPSSAMRAASNFITAGMAGVTMATTTANTEAGAEAEAGEAAEVPLNNVLYYDIHEPISVTELDSLILANARENRIVLVNFNDQKGGYYVGEQERFVTGMIEGIAEGYDQTDFLHIDVLVRDAQGRTMNMDVLRHFQAENKTGVDGTYLEPASAVPFTAVYGRNQIRQDGHVTTVEDLHLFDIAINSYLEPGMTQEARNEQYQRNVKSYAYLLEGESRRRTYPASFPVDDLRNYREGVSQSAAIGMSRSDFLAIVVSAERPELVELTRRAIQGAVASGYFNVGMIIRSENPADVTFNEDDIQAWSWGAAAFTIEDPSGETATSVRLLEGIAEYYTDFVAPEFARLPENHPALAGNIPEPEPKNEPPSPDSP